VSGTIAGEIPKGALFLLRIHFTAQDLTRVTLADEPDPLWEVLLSVHQLQGRDGAGHYGTWRERTRRQLPRPAANLVQLAPPQGYSPDFLTPAESSDTFEEGVERVLSMPRRRYQRELGILAQRRPTSTWTRELADGRTEAVKGLGQALRAYHHYAIAPYWDSIRSVVRTDIQRQVHNLSTAGVGKLLGRLHPSVRWEGQVLQIDGFADRDLHLDGRGLKLQPSVFCWRTPTKLHDPLLPPVLVYPVQYAPGSLHRISADARSRPLSALLGSTRAAALEAIADGCTTTELAKRCLISLAGASRQAAILREAGLITTRRAGQSVRHDLTILGRAVLDGATIGLTPDL
jgi:DNA-binding transcriptional ArsR family regulator